MRDRLYRFGYETTQAQDMVASGHAVLAGRWWRAFVFRDDGTTIGRLLSGMVGEAASRAMDGVLYDRERGVTADYGDLIYWLDGFLSFDLEDFEAYYARYPDGRPKRQLPSRPAVIEAKVFPGRKE